MSIEGPFEAANHVINDILRHTNEHIIVKNMRKKAKPWIIASLKEHALCLVDQIFINKDTKLDD